MAFVLRKSLRTSFAYPKYELNRTYNAPNEISNQTDTSLVPASNQEITTYRKCLKRSYVAVILYQHFCCTSFDIYTFSFLVSSYWFSCKDSLHESTFVLKIERVQRSTINQVVVSIGEILLVETLEPNILPLFIPIKRSDIWINLKICGRQKGVANAI